MSTDQPDAAPARRLGRPRTVSDEDIYRAAIAVVADHGVAGLTLARVAELLHVTPAAVRQRFGSKKGLLTEIARRRTSGVEAGFALARAAEPTALQALEAALMARIEGLAEPRRLANAIATYVDSGGDPDLRAYFESELTEMERGVGRLLEEARAAGEVDVEVTPALASAVFAAFEGVVTLWAIAPRGRVEDRVHETLEIVLGRAFARPR
jgi:AcrR family transcriptional regulator